MGVEPVPHALLVVPRPSFLTVGFFLAPPCLALSPFLGPAVGLRPSRRLSSPGFLPFPHLVLLRPFPECSRTPAVKDAKVLPGQIQELAYEFQIALVGRLENAGRTRDVPQHLISCETFFRRRPLVGEVPRHFRERDPTVPRFIEHTDAELAPRSCTREPVKRLFRSMHLPGINLSVRLCHFRKHAEQTPQEHVLAVLDASFDVACITKTHRRPPSLRSRSSPGGRHACLRTPARLP